MNRVAVFYLEQDLLIAVLKGEFEVQGWPDDAAVVAVNADWARRAIAVLVRSETFGEVAQGVRPPVLGNFSAVGGRVETIKQPDGSERFVMVSQRAERIDLPEGRVRFREFI